MGDVNKRHAVVYVCAARTKQPSTLQVVVLHRRPAINFYRKIVLLAFRSFCLVTYLEANFKRYTGARGSVATLELMLTFNSLSNRKF